MCASFTECCYDAYPENNCGGVGMNSGRQYWNCESLALILSDGGPYGGSQNLFSCVPQQYYVSAGPSALQQSEISEHKRNPLLAGISYEPFGPVTGWTFGNGTTFDRAFELDGCLKSQSFGAGTRTYTFDAASRITKFTDPNHNLTFTHDVLDRLIKSSGTFGRTYDYDAVGNRLLDKKGTTQTDYVTDTSSNRLLSTTSATVTKTRVYDAAGNTLNDGT